MKILLLSNPNSSHTIKWIEGLQISGIDVKLWGFDYSRTKLLQLNDLKNVINEFKPDILHAHYASSYGLIGALSGFEPFVLSVWGSDVFEFPKLNLLNNIILRYNFFKANKILSTSKIMAKEIKLYTKKDIIVTPFGINTDIFKPYEKKDFDSILTFGSVKGLEKIYGLEYALKAFAKLKIKYNHIRFLIVGDGSDKKNLKALSEELNIQNSIDFVGSINYKDIVSYHNKIDILINYSLEESFGVAVLEASACETPVIVSAVGGLFEVVKNEQTGYIVKKENESELYLAMEKLILSQKLRNEFGKNGRKFVEENFKWQNNLEQMINIYKETLK